MSNNNLKIESILTTFSKLIFTVSGVTDSLSQKDIYLYDNSTRLNESDFVFIEENSSYSIIPKKEFSNFHLITLLVKHNNLTSNILSIFFSLSSVYNKDYTYLILSAIVPDKSLSGVNNLKIQQLNNNTLTSDSITITICNGIDPISSEFVQLDTTTSSYIYSILLYDTNFIPVPNSKYILKCYLN